MSDGRLNVLDLFSGIGGFSLGLERAGMHTVAFCESDEFCRAVLRKHWPDVPCFNDVRTLDAGRLGGLGRIDLVCGGFPCQPFSHAGKQRAQADDRHLWPAMREVIALSRPSWVIGENVAGLIALALDDVLLDLEDIGYTTRAFVIPAVAVDARHRRDRVWILARDTNCESKPALPVDDEVAELLRAAADSHSDVVRNESGRRGGSRRENSAEPSNDGEDRTSADADGEGLEGRQRARLRERGAEWPAGASGASAADAASVLRIAFLGDEPNRTHNSARCTWLPEPGVGRVADGVPRRVDRLRTLGNAVVPQVVEEIGRAIMNVRNKSDDLETLQK